jgi:Zn-dependent peptidase ImmA (M78 family)/DNA-binding XRE family transcriptional regulator
MNGIEGIDPTTLGDRLRVARSTAGFTQEEAACKLSIARTTLVAIEQGQRRVRPDELRAFANTYQASVNDLLRVSAIHLDFAAKFRRVVVDTPRNAAAEDAVRLLNRLTSSMVELEGRLNQPLNFHYPPEKKIYTGDIEQQAEDLALDLRHKLGLGLSPIADIVTLVELELGVRIFLRPIDSSISGLFAYDQTVGPCMLINSKHPPERQALTAAHEIGHFLVTRTSPDIINELPSDNTREEKFVNYFALSFLMPAAAVRRRFQDICVNTNRFSPRHLILMAHAMKVSVEAMCRRLEGLRLLPSGTYDSLKERGFAVEAAKKIIGEQGGANFVSTPPRLILMAVEAYKQQLFSEGQLCEMLAMDRVELRSYFDALGGGDLDDAVAFKA